MSMSEVEAMYRIWLRELIRYWRDKGRIVSSLVQPVLFLVIFGGGFGFIQLGNLNYQNFLFPGILAMSLITISISSGISVIWDREFGFLKEILVAPVSRTSIFIGKALGGCTTAMIQGIIVLCLSFFIGVSIPLGSFLLTIPIMLIISLGIVSLGLIIASFIETFENFGFIMNFLIFPMIFLSGALTYLAESPQWLQIVSYLDPLTYGVESLRIIILEVSYPPFIPFSISIMIMSLFSLVAILVGGMAFNRQK